jgi:Leucine-rich repeat (LRR) protein
MIGDLTMIRDLTMIGDLTIVGDLTIIGRLTELPDAIGRLVQLQTIALFGNQLQALPATIGALTR